MFPFILLLLVFSPVATADEQLIKEQCHNAEVPALCIQCVTSDPGGLQADKFGIAAILLNCMQNDTNNIVNQMTELGSSSGDKEMKSVAMNCTKDYTLSTQELSEAARHLKGGDYDRTIASILDAMGYQMACSDDRAKYELVFPKAIVYEMKVYEELTTAAMNVILRF